MALSTTGVTRSHRRSFFVFVQTSLLLAVLAVLAVGSTGCSTDSGASDANAAPASEPAGTQLPVSNAYLTQDLWNDGRAEVAFYRVDRSRDQYGRATGQSFVVGTYLVKHRFSRDEMSKVTDGSGDSAFKYALFYEVESGSYQYKRNWVVNARQRDLAPLYASFTSFDWCSNLFHDVRFMDNGEILYTKRSDDYGHEDLELDPAADPRATALPVALIPFFVRGLDLESENEAAFYVVDPEQGLVSATARLDGEETMSTPGGDRVAERIQVTYAAPVASPVGEETGTTETFWRGTDPARTLIRMSGDDGRYAMTLVEDLRVAYWNENLWPMLERISDRP